MGHIRLARAVDAVVVAPATANFMARTAQGFADDLASTILLATAAPILMAPGDESVHVGTPRHPSQLPPIISTRGSLRLTRKRRNGVWRGRGGDV